MGGKGKQFDYPHEIGKQVESSKIQQASTLRCASLDGMKGLSLSPREERRSSAVCSTPKRPVSFLTYARSRLLTQLSSPRVQRDARHGALAFECFYDSSQSTGLARTISVRTEVALVKLVNVLADG
mgnify:CR=1 FL=1